MNKMDLEKLADIRINEAGVLLENNHYPGAYYLAGYSLECALKACIAKQVKENDFPDKKLAIKSHTHDLMELLGLAGLKQEFENQRSADNDFGLNWAVAKDWNESNRYEATIQKLKAADLYNAITDDKSGILKWLKRYW